MKPGTCRAFASRQPAHRRVPGPESLSLGSLGVLAPMSRNGSLLLILAIGASGFQGCSTFDPPAARPGLSRRETEALIKTYYWKREFPTPSYSDKALDALLASSADPTLDGERAELQASAVAVALAAIGDARFAHSLSRQTEAVRHAVARDISLLWRRYGLHYPRTQSLLE